MKRPFYLFAKHHYYKFYEDNWDYYPNPPGQKYDQNILLKKVSISIFRKIFAQNGYCM